MATPYSQNGGAVVAVRLTDIPLAVRQRYGRLLYQRAVEERDLLLAIDISSAVEHPSDRVYWLPSRAVHAARMRQRW